MDLSIIKTRDLIAPYVEGAFDWKFFADYYNVAITSESRVVDQTIGVESYGYGGYDGWLIVEFRFDGGRPDEPPVWVYSYKVYRVTGSFIFPVEF